METITGTAAGVPFTALAPTGADRPAPLIVTWHMLDAPRTDAAFAAALAALREQLPVDDEPISLLGGSLGGAVALQVLTTQQIPIKTVTLVNPAVRIRSTLAVIEAGSGQAYPWTAEAHRAADEPGLEPAPQLPTAKAVDGILTGWFHRQLTAT
ncbi:hypothetical protein SAMN06265360_101147 [Haloechinothrix alba]|uniref:Alpha/beta hydrolase family protein n=1 Tax=Haloechinothrix alba TaxID=664784 RepID=A0A238V368_9PSEU|nr:hypothetical protein [Haloechinothrix alba]SNR27969.1 hypothetical protein SAMN06265360_101147 [Haloechinothrix alba]